MKNQWTSSTVTSFEATPNQTQDWNREKPLKSENPYTSKKACYYALGLLTFIYAFNFIDRQLLAILQEPIKAELGLSDTHLGLLTGFAFAIFYVIAGVPIAAWADRSNRSNILALAIFVWSFMTTLSAFVQNFLQMLLVRIGVGVGEAGATPPSHSMISDIFPPQRRATALSIYSSGINIGIMFGFLFGGWMNEFFGWRVAFLVCGVPGVLLAILVRKTLKEPIRGITSPKAATDDPIPVKQVLALLWSRPSFRYMAVASGLTAFTGAIAANWGASFMIRTHGMSTGELGTWLAMIFGIGGAIGLLSGGFIVDWLSPRDRRWHMWVPALTTLIAAPLSAGVYLADNGYTSLLFFFPAMAFSNAFFGATVAASHALVGAKMRAMTSAIFYLVANILGLGLGPWTVGMISDSLAPTYGTESLRYAMLMVAPLALLLAACCFFLASHSLRNDIERAPG